MIQPEPAPRSWLFVPADRASRWLASADEAGPDAIVVDLEDGVPAAARPAARRAMAEALRVRDGRSPVYVRVNRVGSEWARDDVRAAARSGAAGILLPKVERGEQIATAKAWWSQETERPPSLIALVETPRGVLKAVELAEADDSVAGLAFGAEDLAAAVGLRRTSDGLEVFVARSLVALAAAAAGRWAIDTPCLELEDLAAVELDARRAAGLGFDGKLAIHPRQVAAIHRGFEPDPDELARARAVVDAARAAATEGRAVTRSADRMVDGPIVDRARRLLDRAPRARREGMGG